MKLIQPGNSKLHNAYMFNLPATKEVPSVDITDGVVDALEEV